MGNNYRGPLSPRSQVRGAIPKKVSDLENDIHYITKDEMLRLSEIEGYSGINNSKVKVRIDNIEKTIEVETLMEDVKDLLPRADLGGYVDGNYMLMATIVGGVPTLQWATVSEGGEVQAPYYYGLVTVSSVDEINVDLIKGLTTDGQVKTNKEYRFTSNRQRQVLAYPVEFGELSRIIHKETGFNVTNMFEKKIININGVGYLVYISFNPSTGIYTYTFEY